MKQKHINKMAKDKTLQNANDGKIHYSDLIQPDDSFDKLIAKVESLDSIFGEVTNNVKQYAQQLLASLKSTNAKTSDGKRALNDYATAADMLATTFDQLLLAMSNAGKVQVWLKNQIRETNKVTLEQQKAASLAEGSYDKLKNNLQSLAVQYKSLSAAERAASGETILQQIKQLNNELNKIEVNLKSAFAKEEFVIAEDSIAGIKAKISELKSQYNLLSKAARDGLAGQDILINIKIYEEELDKIQAKVKSVFATGEIKLANDSIAALSLKIAELRTQYEQMSAESRKSTRGQSIIAEIGNLTEQLNEAKLSLTKLHNTKIASDSIEGLKQQINDLTQSYNTLAKSERDSAMGQDIIAKIQTLKSELKDAKLAFDSAFNLQDIAAPADSIEGLKSAMSEIKNVYSLLDKNTREGAFGQQLIQDLAQLNAQLKEAETTLNNMNKPIYSLDDESINALKFRLQELEKEYKSLDASTASGAAQRKSLIDSIADIKAQLTSLSKEEREAIRVAELTNIVNSSNVGSYEQLSAQYELNKIALNKLSLSERAAGTAGEELEKQTFQIYQQMKRLQEATGSTRLNVGNYTQVWDGLSFSVTQVVRELPAATVSLNTFFLAISNNIPMVVDEIKKLQAANAAAVASGGKAKSVIGTIAKSLFSWQSALVVVLTAFSAYGEEIINFTKQLFSFNSQVISTEKALRNARKEVGDISKKYGEQIATLYSLRREWLQLKTTAEKTQWIKDNKSEFDKLDASITTVNDAERLFREGTDGFVQALIKRAMAEAAANKAAEAYARAVEKRVKADEKKAKADKAKAAYDASIANGDSGDNRSFVGVVVGAAAADTKVADNTYAPNLSKQAVAYGIATAEANAAERAYKQATKEGDKYMELQADFAAQAEEIMKGLGLTGKTKGPEGKEHDLTSYLENMALRVKKLYDDLLEANEPDELNRREVKIKNDYEETIQTLNKILTENNNKLSKNHKALTKEQLALLQESNDNIQKALIEAEKKRTQQEEQLRLDRRIARLAQIDKEGQLFIEGERDNTEAEFQMRLHLLNVNMQKEIIENNKLVERERVSEEAIREKYNREREKLELEHQNAMLEIRNKTNDLIIGSTRKFSQEELDAEIDNINIEYTKAINENNNLAKEQQQDELLITAYYRDKISALFEDYFNDRLSKRQAADKAEFEIIKHNAYETTKFELNQEREKWALQLALAEKGIIKLSDDEIREIKANLKRIENEIKDNAASLFKDGLMDAFLKALGVDDDSIDAFNNAKQRIIDGLNEILRAEIDITTREIELQQEKVNAAKTAYEAEAQARANGYANSVRTAKNELQLHQNTLRKKQEALERYQHAQLVIDSVTQASSLTTATANIWSSFSKLGVPGYILAALATAGMFAAFITSRTKAYQLTATYGEGGLEFLEGGSHASGNDIDLHTTNSRGKRMRAEGGEAMAIINKRKTRKYKALLPDIVNSLNAGTFEDKYIRAYDVAGSTIINDSSTDLSKLERGVDKLVETNATRIIQLSDRVIIYDGNVKRTIKK